jgi:uncharacterized iron-regulated protein
MKLGMNRVAGTLVVGLIGLVAGCATTPHADGPAPLEASPRTRAVVFDGKTGKTVAWEVLAARARSVDVVFIGESHGHPLGLSAAAALWDDILATEDDAALALEFFERDQQSMIDDYLGDVVDEEKFQTLARRTTGNYPPGHRAMLEAAKAKGRPVFAANAPRRYLKVGREGYDGYDGFTEEQRRLLVVPDEMPGGDYRDNFMEMMSGMFTAHATTDDSGEPEQSEEEIEAEVSKMFRSQSIWDATMSDTVARAVGQGYSPVVLVIGNFHVKDHGGTVQLFERAQPDATHLVLLVTDKSGDELEEEDEGSADFVLYVGEEE